METVTTRLSENEISKLDWLARFHHTNRSQILRKVIDEGLEEELIEQALHLYQNGEITLWKAAELAEKSLSSMMDEAHKRKIPHQYSIDDFLQDMETLERIE
ncbi:MAG TPA: UPF0175 family protein [archaeon]|jgi:predicted HTH domain antitoxin|nr:UPF0175 family protein [archaeon]